jgi:hypothetical protein
MSVLRAVLIAYCLLAIAALVVLLVLNLDSVRGMQDQVEPGEALLKQRTSAAHRAEAEYHDLESAQRRERANYTGPQAVESGAAVLLAKQQMVTARQQKLEAERALAMLHQQLEKQLLWFVPLVGLLLVHLLGMLLVGPRGLWASRSGSRQG